MATGYPESPVDLVDAGEFAQHDGFGHLPTDLADTAGAGLDQP
ncbi:hypothetical protein [Pilimelia terevasa]|nr:hypothetical protein [Pilimelia terevasa]